MLGIALYAEQRRRPLLQTRVQVSQGVEQERHARGTHAAAANEVRVEDEYREHVAAAVDCSGKGAVADA